MVSLIRIGLCDRDAASLPESNVAHASRSVRGADFPALYYIIVYMYYMHSTGKSTEKNKKKKSSPKTGAEALPPFACSWGTCYDFNQHKHEDESLLGKNISSDCGIFFILIEAKRGQCLEGTAGARVSHSWNMMR